MALIDVNDISYFYQDGDTQRYILRDITCSFERGKFYTVLGESGSGKTTFLALLSALDQPKAGNILFEGADINAIGSDKYRRNKISIIFQAYNLVPYMTALENVKVAMSITDNKLPDDVDSVAYNLLDYIGITRERANRTVNKLSGGEQQRVAIARALATNVDVILADEPTGNLDDEMESEIVRIFKRLASEHNKCVIVVTHSSIISNEADETFRLRKGRFEQHGQPDEQAEYPDPEAQYSNPEAQYTNPESQYTDPEPQYPIEASGQEARADIPNPE